MSGTCTGPGPCDTAPIGLKSNWVTKVNGLPEYIRAIAHAFLRNGHSESESIQLAVGIVQRWARGEGNVTAATRARAAKALSSWESKKAASHAKRNAAVTESSSAGDLLPNGPNPSQAKKVVDELSDVPHAFRGSDPKHCSVCGMGATAAIHRKKRQRASGRRHRGPGHHPVQTGHIAGNVHRRRVAMKASFNADADQVEPQMEQAMRELFEQQRKATISRLTGSRGRKMLNRAAPPEDAPDTEAPPPNAGQIFDAGFWSQKTAQVAQKVYDVAGRLSRNRVQSQLGHAAQSADESNSLASVTSILQARANRMAQDVTDTTFRQIQDQLAEGAQNGENVRKLADRVHTVFDRASKSRASLIARTETIGALNEAANSYAVGLPSGIVARKQWLAHHDSRTRPTHRMADGQEVPIGLPFHVGISLMQHPGDPTAPPDEVCNCRCNVAYLPATSALSLKEAA